MACRLFGVKPLSKPVLCYCQLDPLEQTSVKFETKYEAFHWRKCIWNCRLPKWRPWWVNKFYHGGLSLWGDQPANNNLLGQLTHWGRVTHIYVSKLTNIGSDNGLSPGRRQAIIWTNDGLLLIGPLGTNLNETSIEIHTFSFKKIQLKLSSGKWRPFCLGLNVLIHIYVPHKCCQYSQIYCMW